MAVNGVDLRGCPISLIQKHIVGPLGTAIDLQFFRPTEGSSFQVRLARSNNKPERCSVLGFNFHLNLSKKKLILITSVAGPRAARH